jgi:uncharacterized protein YecE (DUF72 family)
MIRVGTCSWTEKTLLASGEFYPAEARTAEARLRYYGSQFNTVEVDSTYYAVPDPHTAWLWSMRTPDDFTFHIKVYGALTGHPIDPRTLPQDMRELGGIGSQSGKARVYVNEWNALRLIGKLFIDALSPLRNANKIGLLLFQFPPWFDYRVSHMDHIIFCRDLADGLPVAVEFRHGSWLLSHRAPEVFAFLQKNDITYVAADEPQYGTVATIPFVPRVTSDTAYFRFHGRNRENWLKKGVETSLRYAYSYSDAELLRDLMPSLKEAEGEARTTYAMFNNCHRGNATTNALRLKELLKDGEA